MTSRTSIEAGLLVVVVASCWLGVIGMVRMRTPVQALHYLSLPATGGGIALVAVFFVATGNSQTSWKAVMICVILLAINSIVAHATARAFRARELGHWEPRDGESMQWVYPREEKG